MYFVVEVENRIEIGDTLGLMVVNMKKLIEVIVVEHR
jgi:hypothetical protein